MAAGRASSARWGMFRALGLALRAAARPGAPGMGERLAAVPRMARAALRGEYAGLTRGRLLGMLAALVYIVSPVDLVPEGLFTVFGLADDAMLVAWLASALVNDTEAFLHWERGLSHGRQDSGQGSSGQGSSGQGSGQGPWTGEPQDASADVWTVQSHVVR